MRRAVKILAWIVGVIIAIPIVAVVALLVVANTGWGQREVSALVGQATGGQVTIDDFGGRFPDRLRVGRIEVRDTKGVWLSLAGVVLDWSPLALLGREVSVQELAAAEIHVARQPVTASSATTSSSSGSGSFELPVRIGLARLRVDRLVLDAPVAGVAAVVSVAGEATVASLQQGAATLAVDRVDGAGSYRVTGRIDAARIVAALHAGEPAGGLVSQVAGLPDLGALAADATVDGPRDRLAVKANVGAGPMRVSADGTVDVVGMAADLTVSAQAPAMAPRADVSWQSVAVDAKVRGPLARPDATGTVRIEGVSAGGAGVRTVALDVTGNQGAVAAQGSLAGLRLPGPNPDLFAADPVMLAATARLDAADRPVTLKVTHKLLDVAANATLAPSLRADVTLHLADLAPFGALGGVALQGGADVTAHATQAGSRMAATAEGKVSLTGGMAPLPGLIGDATLSLAAAQDGATITIDHARVAGRTLTADVSGSDADGRLALDWKTALSDLAVLAPNLAGHLAASGTISGPTNGFAAAADVTGEVTTRDVASGPLHATLRAEGLPGAPQATLTADGSLAGSPLAIAATVSRAADGGLAARIERLAWQSAKVDGAFALPAGASLPTGQLNLAMTKLDQLQPLIGTAVTGSITAVADLPAQNAPLSLTVTGRGVGVPGNRVDKLDIAGRVVDPAGRRTVEMVATATGIAAAGASGNVRLQANGPQDALVVKLTADGRDPSDQPAQAGVSATIDATAKTVLLSALTADWHGLQTRLLGPAKVTLAEGVAVDRLRIGLGAATIDLAGKLSPTLDATLAVRNVTPDLAKPFAPDLAADGVLQADARLTGPDSRPDGQIKVTASGLRMRTGPARSLPPAAVNVTADLAAGIARLDATVTAGKNRLALNGQAPMASTGALALKLTGGVDLALLDPILSANGQRVRGQIGLDAAVGGTAQAPRIDGTVRLANGEVQDFTQGLHLTKVTAILVAAGDTVTIQQFTAQAGKGSLSAGGTIGVLAPDLPVDLTLTARQARVLASDQMTATIDADFTVQGPAKQAAGQAIAAAGKLTIDAAEIRIPETMPASVVSLPVLRTGQKPPPPPAPGPSITLAIDILAPNPIFVRGRGLFAELEGRMKVGGTAAAPVPSGGLTMRRGTLTVAGTTLTFTKGEVQFGGGGLTDPDIDFVASSVNGSVTANLEITGPASRPKIVLSSTPELPQDEVLAQLLFGSSESQLSPFQIASIAATLAEFSGAANGLSDPLEGVRSGLGLDRLSVGGGGSGSTPTLQAGRYVAPGIYVGAKQALGSSTPSNGAADPTTQATVQIDLTKRLKVEGDAGSGVGANAVGLTYQFEY
jgi:translocation and assembly module TamB